MTRRALAAALLVALPALAAAQIGPVPPPPMAATPGVLQEIGFDQKLGDAIPLDLAFQDETGKDVKLGDYFGKSPSSSVLVYYDCPMLCTLGLNGGVGRSRCSPSSPGQEFEVVTVSFDPREGPVLARRRRRPTSPRHDRPGAEKGWHFLTGPKESIGPAHEGGRLPLRLRRGDEAVRAPRRDLVATPEGKYLALPLRRRVRPEGPAPRARGAPRAGRSATRRPGPPLLLPLRPRRGATAASITRPRAGGGGPDLLALGGFMLPRPRGAGGSPTARAAARTDD